MADATYDAIVIGGGTKGLVTAMYLAKYGGMKVAIFENRHEVGGGWSSEEPAPGFIGNTHMNNCGDWYNYVLDRDFPEWIERGGKFVPHYVPASAIFSEDHSCLVMYGAEADPNQEKTAASIARFSERDAEQWLRMWGNWKEFVHDAFLEWFFSPPTPYGEPDAMERALRNPKVGFDPVWLVKSPLEVLRDLFESDEVISALLRISHSWSSNSPILSAAGIAQALLPVAKVHFGVAAGGTHSWAHGAYKVFTELGGKTFTKSEVDKVLIENGRATGIRLTNGTEVAAKQLVVSSLDPYQLCFRLIGEEHFGSRTLRRVKHLSRDLICITWYSWALHELPNYHAAKWNPDINKAGVVVLIDKDPMRMVRNHAYRYLGKQPEELALSLFANTQSDPLQAPEGKHWIGSEEFVLPANALDEKGWRAYKKHHAEETIECWEKYAPNMTWDNVIDYNPLTPYDSIGLLNMGPQGNWAVIDHIPSQMTRYRPVPELAQHRTPIKGLYGTGAAWHPGGGGFACQGYNCYKIIAEDYGLEKPWVKLGAPF
ncbi:MAG: NAD(P)/FAD-dependent oxidoreductase [Chloroflexi bacterium]|nr:NAD(P)/FAD-dependent oxidoreductase [Chloroflexota bacterium]